VNGYGGGGGTAVVNGDLTGFTTYYGQLTNLPPKNHGETAAQRPDENFRLFLIPSGLSFIEERSEFTTRP
jgi:hypothetical protein